MALQNFVDFTTPVVGAAWLNEVDRIRFTYERTAAEIAVGVTPVAPQWRELDVRRYGAALNGVTNDRTALANADLVAGGRYILGCDAGIMYIATSLTINSPIEDTCKQIFTTTSAITLAGCPFVRPEWFGSAASNIRFAVNALPSTGGIVQLRDLTYPPSYDTADGSGDVPGVDYLAKQGVKLRGTLPAWNSAHDGFVAGTGTIIQGLFAVFADGFEIQGGLGVDCSDPVVTALYGGTAKDAFVFFQPDKGAPTYKQNLRIDAIRGVAKSPGSMIHAVLIEAVQNGVIGLMEGSNAYHATVIKSLYVQVGMVRSFLAGGEGLICKSDDYANMGAVQIGEAILNCSSSTYGLRIEATGAPGGQVQIDSVRINGAVAGISIGSNGQILAEVQIGKAIVDGGTTGVTFDGARRANIEQLVLNNLTSHGIVTTANQSTPARVGTYHATNIAGNAVSVSGLLRLGNITVDAVTGYAFSYAGGGGRIFLEGGYTAVTAPTAGYWDLSSALINSWVNFGAGNSTWSITLGNGKVRLKGLIKSGVGNIINLSAQVRPSEDLRFPAAAQYGGPTFDVAETIISAGGGIGLANPLVAATYVSMDGIEWPVPGF